MTEPVLIGLAPAIITGFIAAVVNFLNAFGLLVITETQLDALNKLAIAVILIVGGVGAWYARSKVTPTAAPTLVSGTSVTVTNPDPAIADKKKVM